MTAPAEPSERAPAREEPDAVEREEPAPEPEQDQYSEGSRIEYAEESPSPERGTDPGTGEGAAGEAEQTREAEGSGNVFGDNVMRDLEGSGSGARTAQGDSQAQVAGEAGRAGDTGTAEGSGTGQGTAAGVPGGTGDSDVRVDLEGEGSRELLQRPTPQLTPEQVAQLPPRISVTIDFRLDPRGIIRDAAMRRGTGNPEVDAKILETIRGSWRFDRSDGDRTVGGTLTITLRIGQDG
jgi:outer membrane biosynthesis protein TonB